MKKVLSLAAAACVLAFVGCPDDDGDSAEPTTSLGTTTTTTTTEDTTTTTTTTAPPDVPGQPLTLDLGNGVNMELVWIAPGSYLMGSEKGYADEKPVHQVTITKPFYMGKYEVTQEQWGALMGSNPSYHVGARNPVEQVSWNDCQDFFARLKEKAQGRDARLPTEAEWEYACRAGSQTAYFFGDDGTQLGDYAWFMDNSGGSTHPVGERMANAWGLYDVYGNVWEHCSDWYSPYGSAPETDPVGPTPSGGASLRVTRGGSWSFSPGICRSACRNNYGDPDDSSFTLGVRVVVVVR